MIKLTSDQTAFEYHPTTNNISKTSCTLSLIYRGFQNLQIMWDCSQNGRVSVGGQPDLSNRLLR